MQDKSLTIVSIGGNTLIRKGEKGTIEEQFEHTEKCMAYIAKMASQGKRIVITHGNGPIVGNIVIRNEAAKDIIPPMPLYICNADSEGGIGFMLQQALYNQLKKLNARRDVATIVTQVVVDKNDPAFSKPTKPIGPFYTKKEAKIFQKEKGWTIIEDSNRGYRRVVPSPKPLKVIEADIIKRLAIDGVIVIAAGGGGVPVMELQGGTLKGIDAVIDKDIATAVLANTIGAAAFIDLTSSEKVYINFGKPNQKAMDRLTVSEAKKYLSAGEFAPGSMGPKIEAAIGFLKAGGKEVIITTSELLESAMEGKAGTRIVK
ncbi:MAG TPA: carbamate kinase [Deltaproteobacteria bacterium]|nr:MAG: carbamate kinase [Deltaproteobacteria bacterium GWA2_43_19]HBR17851.1 carbamate kinase [Deltaproteobacteria bacterium]